MVWIPPEVHRKLAIQAAEAGVSLNRITSSKFHPETGNKKHQTNPENPVNHVKEISLTNPPQFPKPSPSPSQFHPIQ